MARNHIHRWKKQLPGWVDRRVLLFFAIVAIFTVAMAWGEPLPQAAAKSSRSSTQMEVTLIQPELKENAKESALSPEMMANQAQTNGLIIGSVVLLLIVFGTSFSAYYQKMRHPS